MMTSMGRRRTPRTLASESLAAYRQHPSAAGSLALHPGIFISMDRAIDDSTRRMECTKCECHTLETRCGNCGSMMLRPVPESAGDRLYSSSRAGLYARTRPPGRGFAPHPVAGA